MTNKNPYAALSKRLTIYLGYKEDGQAIRNALDAIAKAKGITINALVLLAIKKIIAENASQ